MVRFNANLGYQAQAMCHYLLMLYCESHELVRAANLGRLALVLFHFWDAIREGGEGYWLHTRAAFENLWMA